MENKYFDIDTALKQASELHTFIISKVNIDNIIDVVTYSQEMRIFRNQNWIRKQYLNSLFGWCCSVRHRNK